MQVLKDFLNYTLLTIGDYQLQIKQVLTALLVIIISAIVYFLARRYLIKSGLSKRLSIHNSKSVSRFIKVLVFIGGLGFILRSLGINTKSILAYELIKTEKISITLSNLIVLLIIFFVTKFVLYLIELAFDDKVKGEKMEAGKSRSIFQIVKYVIWVLAIAFFLESMGFSITFIIASLSALLIGLGLGIQQLFNDFVSGIIILFDHSIKVGDIVEVEGEMIGKVQDISLRTSKLISRDDVIVILPNSLFTSQRVINWSHNTFKTRFGVTVGVAYGSDVRKVEKILIDAAKEHPDIDDYPLPKVLFRDFGDSSLDFELMFFTRKAFRVELIKSDIRFTINQKFAEQGVTIPFPQRDVHFYKE